MMDSDFAPHASGHGADCAGEDPVAREHHVSLPLLGDEAVGQTHQTSTERRQNGGDRSLYRQYPTLPTDPEG